MTKCSLDIERDKGWVCSILLGLDGDLIRGELDDGAAYFNLTLD